jgi:hypothetical protein
MALNVDFDDYSITLRTGNEYGEMQGKLITRKVLKQMMKLPAEFLMMVTLVFVCANILYACNGTLQVFSETFIVESTNDSSRSKTY